jgi:hypothetical protein
MDKGLLKRIILGDYCIIRETYNMKSLPYGKVPNKISCFDIRLFNIDSLMNARSPTKVIFKPNCNMVTHLAINKYVFNGHLHPTSHTFYDVTLAKMTDDDIIQLINLHTYSSKDNLIYHLMKSMPLTDELIAHAKERGLFNETYN